MKKVLLINYKAYKEAFTKGVDIANAAAEVSKETGVDVIVAPPFTMLKETKDLVKTIAQGVDEVDPGAFTAHITWFELKQSGVAGTLLNHSEKRYTYSKGGEIAYDKLQQAIEKCKAAGLETYVCVENLEEARKVAAMEPTAVAYEPPELIGGNISVTSAHPDIVKEFSDLIKKNSSSLPLIGAGVKRAEDAKKSVELGAEGVLVASGIVLANDFKAEIRNLASAMVN
ncbi:triose-phosphate isomerase [Candidatus Parvarchaeota archaeon]|uniref:Triosephosphate isomerase n=1 Tax=Candidatus Acidifodinimicrobium mancum TaxID=2898728 RepID=A0A8T3V2C2_9ARCH|nr:triose-phosphate isomerase [Candidatus Acidifodinimicrobium mancum]MBE5728730.1 triose-phosphate isomerase [Candidatus Acidifodinimicrobium mancum]MBE5730292.1 triose-phosphate isomerase [Candidatus Acidifodinimicrobium mancum]